MDGRFSFDMISNFKIKLTETLKAQLFEYA